MGTRAARAEPPVAFDRSRRRLDKQDAIVRAASHLFSERGFAHVSLDDVARVLRIGKPVLYYYFESKERILFECYSRAFDHADETMREAAALAGTGREKLERYLRGYLLAQLAGEAPVMPMHDIRALSAPLRARIDRRRRARRDRLRDLIAAGVADGSLAQCDPRIVASAWGGAASWIIESFDPRGKVSAEATADAVVRLFIDGIGPRKGAGRTQ